PVPIDEHRTRLGLRRNPSGNDLPRFLIRTGARLRRDLDNQIQPTSAVRWFLDPVDLSVDPHDDVDRAVDAFEVRHLLRVARITDVVRHRASPPKARDCTQRGTLSVHSGPSPAFSFSRLKKGPDLGCL